MKKRNDRHLIFLEASFCIKSTLKKNIFLFVVVAMNFIDKCFEVVYHDIVLEKNVYDCFLNEREEKKTLFGFFYFKIV